MKLKEILFYVIIAFDEIDILIETITNVKSENLDELHELGICFQYTIDRLEMNIRALRDKLNEPEIL